MLFHWYPLWFHMVKCLPISSIASGIASYPTIRYTELRQGDSAMSATTELKPFPVIAGKYLFWFEPDPEGSGFSVTCQNLEGVNAQGDTFEEALADALSCAAFVEECLADIAREEAEKAVSR
jgi:predicted RNase H-like HicB family nuclease